MAKKKAAKKKSTKKAPRARSPRSQVLPGLEQTRNARLDALCESIGDCRDIINAKKDEEKSAVQAACAEMERKDLVVHRHARVELVLVPGAAKLRVRMTKEQGDRNVQQADEDAGDDGNDDQSDE